MKRKQKTRKIAFTVFAIAFALLMTFPFIWMLFCSFKPLNEIYEFPPRFFSGNMSFDNYKEVLFDQNPSFFLYLRNTVITTLLSVLGTAITSSMAGYAFAKMKFRFRNQLFLLYLVTMMVPFQVLMVPQFILFKHMGIFNTLWALILPRLFTPLGTFLMRQYFLDVPDEIIEAGKVEGLGDFGIFSKLVLPLAKPAMSTVVILNFVWRWNDYEAPLIFLTDNKLYTLTVGLTNFIDEAGFSQDNLIMAAATIALVPIIVVFIFGQRYFIEGLTSGSVKG